MGKWMWRVLILFFAAVFVFSGWQLFTILRAYQEGQNSYASMEQYISFIETENTAPGTAPTVPPTEDSSDVTEAPDPSPWPQVAFDQLSKINPDIVAWIYIEGTNINYPVVQGSDNSYYLNRLFDGSYNNSGCIFLDAACASDFSHPHSILYGHHMKDKSMFSALTDYKDQAFYDEHSVAFLITPSACYKIQFFSGYVSDTWGNAWDLNFHEDEYMGWLNDIQQKSYFASDHAPTGADRIITLSTCSYEFDTAKFVLHGYISEVMENTTAND